MEKKLQVRSLRISFRTVSGKLQALRDISFDLYKGETLAIVGESGSGKSVTSKAILGILAGNAIIEGGEILYDGQDLLKISEEDFYKLRGDKLSMIFQDPLSSLNPIMRIGKQLTEAMLLKGKARQRANRRDFNQKMKLLQEAMKAADPAKADGVGEKCGRFNRLEMKRIELEQAYNEAFEAANEALVEIENILFLIDKKALKDASVRFREVRNFALRAENPYVVTKSDAPALRAAARSLTTGVRGQVRSGDYARAASSLKAIQEILSRATSGEKPDFFAISYVQQADNGAVPSGDRAAINARCRQALDEGFMVEFSGMVQKGLDGNDEKYARLRKAAEKELDSAMKVFEKGVPDDASASAAVNALTRAVDASVNPLDVVKDSLVCTFSGSLRAFMDTYRRGERTNGRKIRAYQRQLARHRKLEERGRKPDWTVAEPSIVDLEQTHKNILLLMVRLKEHYAGLDEADARRDTARKAQVLIDSIQANASGMVEKMTKRRARNKALKLMEEVGIPEPRKRYRDYPFQFSGGMRQRIVIAIALAANPDILICDEPTTALDVTIQAQILELINKLKKERQLTVIFITHDLGVVANMADRIAVMYAGKIVEYGLSEEIFYEPAHPYTWALLSSMPDLETHEKLEAIPGTPPNMIYPPKGDAFAERNLYAMKIDQKRQPPMFPITDTHWAATWLLHPDAPKVEMPKAVSERIRNMRARMGGERNAQ